MECGTELKAKHLENEGNIPIATVARDIDSLCSTRAVSMVILNKEQNKILRIKQYVGRLYSVCGIRQ